MSTEPKTRPTDEPFDAFVARQPPKRQADCRALDAMLMQATGEQAQMWGEIVGYGRYLDTRKDGKQFEWPLAGFASRKQSLVVYLVPGFESREDLMRRLGKYTHSKACLYVKTLTDVDADVLRELVELSVAAMQPKRVP